MFDTFFKMLNNVYCTVCMFFSFEGAKPLSLALSPDSNPKLLTLTSYLDAGTIKERTARLLYCSSTMLISSRLCYYPIGPLV